MKFQIGLRKYFVLVILVVSHVSLGKISVDGAAGSTCAQEKDGQRWLECNHYPISELVSGFSLADWANATECDPQDPAFTACLGEVLKSNTAENAHRCSRATTAIQYKNCSEGGDALVELIPQK